MNNNSIKKSIFYRLRWFLLTVLGLALLLGYANLSGWRILSTSKQESWSASSPGNYHK